MMNSQKLYDTESISVFKKIFSYVRPYMGLFLLVLFLAISISGLGVFRTYLFKIVVNDYILPKDYAGLLQMMLFMGGLLLWEASSQVGFSYYASWLGQRIIYDIRTELMQKMLRFKMQYFNKSSVGVLVTRAVNDMERIGEVFSAGLFEIFSEFLKMSVVVVVMLCVDWQLTLIVLMMLPIILYATNWFQRSMQEAFKEVRLQVANLNSFVQERVTGMKIIQLFAREKVEYEQFQQINKKHQNAWLDNIWLNSVFFPIADIVTSITIGLVVWYGGNFSHQRGTDLGTIFMFIQLVQMLFQPLRHIADKFNVLQMGIIAAGRVFAINDNAHQQMESQEDLPPIDIQGDIRFEGIHFGYNPNEEILHGISFEVKKGQTIAIVGATGAGKSTIINLLNRFYQVQKGHIYIDNQDIYQVQLASLRQQIAVVLQDVFLFADTILNNITMKNPLISQAQVVEAAKAIGIHEFIEKLPDGYYFNVKERGSMLSVGQRQLIAFLRAYVHQPKILVLDEATSSVDTHSEELIQRATERITQGRTSIVIAHRLTTVRKADNIIVLDKGNIVEQGTHQQLILKENGYYRKLYEVQLMQKGK